MFINFLPFNFLPRIEPSVRTRTSCLIFISAFIFLSCATTLTFDVDHPPIVDLRGVKTITVIPLEWDAGYRYSEFAKHVTSALVFGVRRGNIDYVDPAVLQSVPTLEYWKHVDVYITGRITNVRVGDDVYSRDEEWGNTTRTTISRTRTVIVDIEYEYIRAYNNEVLGHFKKSTSQTGGAGEQVLYYIETDRFRNQHSTGRNRNNYHRERNRNNYYRERDRRRRTQDYQLYDLTDDIQLTNTIAARAINQFSHAAWREQNIWTTTETRNLKGNTSGLSEAKRMIRRRYFGRAYEIYSEMYEQTGNINAGYNLALMMQFDNKYTDALELLKQIEKNIIESGKRVPAFITREIITITEFVQGFRILEGYRD